MLTWNMYGTWLQGDGRGYVKDGEAVKKNSRLRDDNEQRLSNDAVRFGNREKQVVEQAIKDEAGRQEVIVHAISVCSNHVHVVIGYCDQSIGEIVGRFKNAGRVALRDIGFEGRVWARGYDKRFCFDVQSLEARIRYVNKHCEG